MTTNREKQRLAKYERAKDAIRYGMAMASLYTCRCQRYIISTEDQMPVK